MTKNKFNKAVYGQWNEVRKVENLFIAKVCFHHKVWKIIDSLDFEKAKMIKEGFKTRDELWEALQSQKLLT